MIASRPKNVTANMEYRALSPQGPGGNSSTQANNPNNAGGGGLSGFGQWAQGVDWGGLFGNILDFIGDIRGNNDAPGGGTQGGSNTYGGGGFQGGGSGGSGDSPISPTVMWVIGGAFAFMFLMMMMMMIVMMFKK